MKKLLFGFGSTQVLLALLISGQTFKTFEFEQVFGSPGKPRTQWRSGASGSSALHVFDGDRVEISLCLLEPTTLSIAGLQYSNDGNGDQVDFWIDEKYMGTIYTKSASGSGMLWNVFSQVGRIGDAVTLSPGKHTLVVIVVKSDCHGLEIDNLEFTSDINVPDELFTCESKFFPSLKPTACAEKMDSPQQRRLMG
ncbi:hypothetical protein DPMN_181668 [Dreissena polymorpha]|uniref:Uncharacterized protein n=1 Tax=Dreissena polymorpha TaxID=45954 RepID=A0A9D4DEX8_DREPO|nr:hypothetical protein DPMN_181668 [Dreissena polymorpha]